MFLNSFNATHEVTYRIIVPSDDTNTIRNSMVYPTYDVHGILSYILRIIMFAAFIAWWHHQMETFSALMAIYTGIAPVTGEFPAKRPVTRSFDVFFDLHLNERLSKQWWGWWFEIPSRPLWRHRMGPTFDTPDQIKYTFKAQ